MLLRCGASPTALNSDDLSPADLAEALKHCDVSEEIRLAKQRLGSEDEDHDVSL